LLVLWLLGEEAAALPSIGNALWRVSTMFTRPTGYNSAGSERIWMKFGYSEYTVWSWPWQILGVICAEARLGSDPKFWFFCHINNAWLYRFPVSQISLNLHTRRGSERWWILLENIFENLPVRGLFSKKVNFCVNIVNEFWLQAAISAKLQIAASHDWLARLRNVGFPWNQLSHSPACRLRTRHDIPGHCWLFRLALQT